MSRLRASSVLSALALAIGCSLVVPAELDQIHCSQPGTIGPPACDPGFVCAQGICQRCAAIETCGDGLDNDCAGGIDDGCALAGAGGGGTAGSGGSFGGSGGTVPDGSLGGSSGSGGLSGQAGEGAGGAQGGESGSSGSGGGGAPGIGTPCPAGNECAAGDFCAQASAFGLQPGNVCTRGCCKSDDCGAGNVCYSTTGGNTLCFPNTLAGRPLGATPVGVACAGHQDCRTGLCLGGICTDACCSNGDCPANIGACKARDIGGRNAFVCSPPVGANYNDNCWNGSYTNPQPVHSACASGVCVQSQYVYPPFTCSKTCCRATDCSDGLKCRYGALGQPTLKYCRLPPASGSGQIGDTCSGPGDCQSGFCVQPEGGPAFCSDACCRDLDCGIPGQFACRPGVLSGIAHLICVKL